jgi:GNAT superfamily N-acetyltransferase
MIRAAQAADGAGIRLTAEQAGVFNPEEVACVDELWNEYLQKGAAESGYDFIVDRDGDVVRGFACFGPHPLTEGTYDLYWIAVHPDYRRLTQAGGRVLIAETSGKPEYAATRQFYLSAGFQAEATIRDFYSRGDDLVMFTRHLDG